VIPLGEAPPGAFAGVRGVFCDIDDTLTWEGRLVPAAFQALQRLQDAGLRVVPVTGRPGGWVDQIARMWPVDGVVGENGGLWFWQRRLDDGAPVPAGRRRTEPPTATRLDAFARRILVEVPGAALGFRPALPGPRPRHRLLRGCAAPGDAAVDQIVASCSKTRAATCKVSSIHVNGWFGAFDKLHGLSTVAWHEADRSEDLEDERDRWVFVGDSANDEPMFELLSALGRRRERGGASCRVWPTAPPGSPRLKGA
jgi:hypothetical protein